MNNASNEKASEVDGSLNARLNFAQETQTGEHASPSPRTERAWKHAKQHSSSGENSRHVTDSLAHCLSGGECATDVLPSLVQSECRVGTNPREELQVGEARASARATHLGSSADVPGLSKAHTSPLSTLTCYRDSSYFNLKIPMGIQVASHERGIRKEITGFSRQSRKRFMDQLAKTQKETKPYLFTLTYPLEYPTDSKIYKRHFDTFLKRVRRRFKKVCGFWKLEFQKRGAPHYHLIVWGISYEDLLIGELSSWLNEHPEFYSDVALGELQAWVSQAWYESAASGDEKHLRAGTKVETVRKNKDIMAYAAKYVGKLETGAQGVGRFWGCFGREHIPFGQMEVLGLTYQEAIILRRWMKRFAKFKTVLKKQRIKTVYYQGDQITGTRESDEWHPTKVKSNYAKMNLPTLTIYCNVNRWRGNVGRVLNRF